MRDSASPDITLNLERIWFTFDKYFPSGNLKRSLKKAFAEKLGHLDQDKLVAVQLSRHRGSDTSFVIGRKKKGAKEASSGVSTPKKRPEVSAGPSKVPVKKVKTQSPVRTQADSTSGSSNGSMSEEEDLDEKLRRYIAQGFCN